MKFGPARLVDLAVVGFFAILVYEARDWRLQARLYPWAVGIPMLALAVVHLLRGLRGGDDAPSRPPAIDPADVLAALGPDPALARRRVLGVFCWSVGLLAGLWLVGFSIGISLFVFLYLKVQSGEDWRWSLALAGAAWLTFWGLFEWLLRLPVPDGMVLSWLGLR